ncbi:glutathione S-transferase T3-like protein [Tanacetum coccineum]
MVKSRDFNCEGIKRDEKTFDTKADGSVFTSAKEKTPIPEAEPPVFTSGWILMKPQTSPERMKKRRTILKTDEDAKRKNLGVQWVAAYRAAYSRKTSGMNLKDVELDAHKIYEADGSKFLDLTVFNEVMCKNPKWMLNIDRDNTRSHPIDEEPNEESGGSTKRSRTSEEGEMLFTSNQETPNSGGSTIQRPIGRDAAKKKGKGKASQSFSFPNNEFVEELRAMRITRESEIEVMNKRLEVDEKRKEREIKREEKGA